MVSAVSQTERLAGTPATAPQDLVMTTEHLQRNSDLVDRLRGRVILAPLTRGNNLPFRRLCSDFGADVTESEMGFARHLIKGDPKERALLRRAENERCYGVQIATNIIDEGVAAGRLAAEAGADWVDLNCGCPIYEATRRGLGSALLRKPEKLARLVGGIASQLPIPLTVKIRTASAGDDTINVQRVTELLGSVGAAAVTIHGRTAQQRYKKPADWQLIERIARNATVPVIGNGDILTHYEATRRLDDHGCLAVMVGRGALMKPWIFWEVKAGRGLDPTADERVGIYRQLVSYMKSHFGDDEKGRRKAFYFLPWHLGFLARYRPLPESVFSKTSLVRPLLGMRWGGVACQEIGETLDNLPMLERLLRCEHEGAHGEIAAVLWDAASDLDAVATLDRIASEKLVAWETEIKTCGDRGENRASDDRMSEG